MGKLYFFPGQGCLYYRSGHCLYEEVLNPGYNRHWQCKVLLKWEKEYDTLINQAEYFQLNPAQVEGIWEKRMAKRMNFGWECKHYVPREDDVRCAYLYGNVCILALPRCIGRCHLYQYEGFKTTLDEI